MTIFELNDFLLENNIELHLNGEFSCDGESIIWEYDGLGKSNENMEAHINDIFEQDKEILIEFFNDENLIDDFFIHEPEINDSYIKFFITEE